MNITALNKATKNKTRTSGITPFSELDITKIYPNPAQPRKSFENIEELASSIETNGLIQPIAVVKKEDGYMIISGERRYRASLHLQSTTIKAHVIQADAKAVLELSLIENIQREDLTDFEKAKFIGELWASGNYEKKQDLATAIAKSSSYISKAFSCLKLDDEIVRDIEDAKHNIGLSVLEEIARVKDKKLQNEVYKKILSKEIIRDDIKSFIGKKISPVKKKWILECLEDDTKNFSHYNTKAFMEYFHIVIPKDFPQETTPQRYKITIEEI